MAKNLVIVESPAKAKTIEGYLGKDFLVKSSYGHVRDLPTGQLAVDIENNFEPTYEISKDKVELVRELKKLSKEAEIVWLATDDDREGEAISWHLAESLDLSDQKTRRIVFREITKNAIINAIESPRTLDKNLVDAQQARRVLDRLVGYELSPILWKKVQRGLSAGRVQSVAVRLVVEREREIDQHKTETYYKTVAIFEVEKGKRLKAELSEKFETKEEAQSFLEECQKSIFKIQDLEKKPGYKKPSPPFTTSTLQQEAGRKLGYPVSVTMNIAQRLYESGKITYMRTDSLNLSETAIQGAKAEISKAYGSEFSEIRKFKTKSAGAQEAHEAIRPTDFGVHSIVGERNEQKLYDLIWKRAIASQMADAVTERTNVVVDISQSKRKLKAQGEVIKFEGFLKVYIESTDDEEEEESNDMLPPLAVGQAINLNQLTSTQRFTRAAARYTEATLVKQLEEMGIGRPSTYAPTISTIQKREYVEKDTRDGVERSYQVLTLKGGQINNTIQKEITGAEKAKLFPTNMAMVVNDFLVSNFPKVTEFNFTAKIESQFDEIAAGTQNWKKMIDSFYTNFHENVVRSEEISRADVGTSRVIGVHPSNGLTVLVRLGKFGPMAQIGTSEELGEEVKPQFASLRKGQLMENLDLDDALKLFELPKNMGEYNNGEIILGIGRFGPYVKYMESFISIPKNIEPLDVTLEQAIEYIKQREEADAPIGHYDNKPVQKGVGRFGPFIKWDGMFINVNKKYNFDFLTQEDLEQLIEEKIQKESDKVLHNWEKEGIRVEKARWGRSVILKGKLKIELDKTIDAQSLSLDEVKAIIEQKTPKKATAKKAVPKVKK